jgi:hypothetical protein
MSRFNTSLLASALALALVAPVASAASAASADTTMMKGTMPVPKELVGAWALVRCDNVYPDGHRVELYGPSPEGMWLIDAHGDYMMQIVSSKRMPFAVNDKSKGTPEEYKAASMGFNAHYGHVSADANMMHSQIVRASFPNWDGKGGDTAYTIKNDELTYTVAKPSSGAAEGAHGEVVWRRIRS